jgi:SAM-dependent methyltransferase
MDVYANKLSLWEPGTGTVFEQPQAPASPRPHSGPHHPSDFAQRIYAYEALSSSDSSAQRAVEPYTLQWFLDIESHRHGRRGRWIPRLLEFAKHSGDTLLGLGNGLGTDWLQYARHGAQVIVCSPSAAHLDLARRNFELRSLSGRFLHAQPENLPLESATIDVVCINGLLHEAATPAAVVREVYRVLKPGGKVLAVMPARYDVDFWFSFCFPWQRLLVPRHIAGGTKVRFSSRKLRRIFGQFVEHRFYKRQLRRSEVPHIWRWAPMPLLERLMGRALVLKAFKPLSAAIASQNAA